MLIQYQRRRLVHHELLVHRIEESLIVVGQPEHFIGMGEIPEEPEMGPSNYKEVIQDKDVTLWQKA